MCVLSVTRRAGLPAPAHTHTHTHAHPHPHTHTRTPTPAHPHPHTHTHNSRVCEKGVRVNRQKSSLGHDIAALCMFTLAPCGDTSQHAAASAAQRDTGAENKQSARPLME